jgi:hypothetical protein
MTCSVAVFGLGHARIGKQGVASDGRPPEKQLKEVEMAKGLDVQVDCSSKIDCLTSEGFQFVGRYYNTNNPSKNLRLAEAQALSAAGITTVVVWENGFPTKASYFSNAKGVSDAAAALKMSSEIGQPVGSAIYFAVDYDATAADVSGPISQYFQGVKSVFDAAEQQYAIGVYGSGATCQSLLDAGLVTFTWLSQSTGFRGSKTFTAFNIKQGPEATICGMDGDGDDAPDVAACGGFVV